jgi:hypothetical protein
MMENEDNNRWLRDDNPDKIIKKQFVYVSALQEVIETLQKERELIELDYKEVITILYLERNITENILIANNKYLK